MYAELDCYPAEHPAQRLQEDILTLLDDEFGRDYELDVPWHAVLAEPYLYKCVTCSVTLTKGTQHFMQSSA